MNTHLADVDRIKILTPAAYPNVNVKTYCLHVRDKIEILKKANHYDSALNETICRNLATCVAGNPEYSNPLHAMLDKIAEENQALTCMNNREKLVHMKKLKLGWRNVLELALDKYQAQMAPTWIRWPPACNPSDSKTVPAACGNLAQLPAPQHGRAVPKLCGSFPDTRARVQN